MRQKLSYFIITALIIISSFMMTSQSYALEVVNQSTVSYQYNGLEYFTNNSTVITQIGSSYGIDIQPNGSVENPGQTRQGNAGAEVFLSYTLTNTGNTIDSYNLTLTSPAGDFYPADMKIYLDINENGDLNSDEPEVYTIENLPVDDYVMLLVMVLIPFDAEETDNCYININGTSVGDPSVQDTDNVGLVETTPLGNMEVHKQARPKVVETGELVNYEIFFGNNGNAPVTDFSVTDYIDWNGNALHTTYVLGSLTANPQGMLSYFVVEDGEEYWTTAEPTDSTIVKGIRYENPEILVNEQGRVSFYVRVDEDAPPGMVDNYAIYDYDEFEEMETNITHTEVVAIAGIHLGPQNNPEALPGGELSEDDITTIPQVCEGTTVKFVNTVKNAGNLEDVINIHIDDESNIPSNWTVIFYHADGATPLQDGNGDGVADVGVVPAGGVRSFVVKINIPEGAQGDNDGEFWNVMLRAESNSELDVSPNYTINRVETVLPVAAYWAPVTQIVQPSGVVRIDQRLKYVITFANISDSLIEHGILTDPLSDRLINIGDVTTGSIFMRPRNPGSFRGGNKTNQQDSIEVFLEGEYDEEDHTIVWHIYNLPADYEGDVIFYADIRPDTPDESIIPNQAYLVSNRTPVVVASNIVEVYVLRPMIGIDKEATREVVQIGDIVEYKLTVKNISPNADLIDTKVYDVMPPSFRYMKGSSSMNGKKIGDPAVEGNRMIWAIPDTFYAQQKHDIYFNAIVGVNSDIGYHKNITYADGTSSILSIYRDSPVDSALVKVVAGMFRPEGTILGKVFIDENNNKVQEDGEKGVEKVRVYMEDGRYALTDANGQYSFRGITPGTHVVKIDPITIPPDYETAVIGNKFTGDPSSQFAELSSSGIVRSNFRLISLPKVYTEKDYLSREIRILPQETPKPIQMFTIPASLFETGKAELLSVPDDFDKLVRFIEEHPDWQVRVEGHTDPRPIHTEEFPSNWELSQARAQAVADALLERGISEDVMVVKGYAATEPIVPNTSLENMAINRRVEMTLVPPKEETDLNARVQLVFRIQKGDTLMKNVHLITEKPPHSTYIENSAKWEETAANAPIEKDSLFMWNLGTFQEGVTGTFAFGVEIPNEKMPEIIKSQVYLKWKDMDGNEHVSEPFEIQLDPEYRPTTKELVYTFDDFLFDTGKAKLRPLSVYYLSKLLKILNVTYPEATAIVTGHTDIRPIHTPEFPSNIELSQARAKAVYDYLIEKGVEAERLSYKGYGPHKPVAPNTTPENLQKNRRVEVLIQLETPRVTEEKVRRKTRIEVAVETATDLDSLQLTDKLPKNAVYKAGTTRLNGQKISDPIQTDSKLVWNLSDIPKGTTRISYQVNSKSEKDQIQLDSIPKPEVKDTPRIRIMKDRKRKPKVSVAPADSVDAPAIEREINKRKDVFILEPDDGTVYTLRDKITITTEIPLAAKPELYVNGELIDSETSVGTKMLDITAGRGTYIFVSIPILKGENKIIAKANLPANQESTVDSITVYLADRPATVKPETDPSYIPADGLTYPTVIFNILDENGLPVADGIFITLTMNKGQFSSMDAHPDIKGFQIRTKDGKAAVILDPADSPETRLIKGTISEFEFEAEIDFEPELREFILVGVAEGTVGHRSVKGNTENIPFTEREEFEDEMWTEGGVKLFLKGRILGKYLLTAFYDSKKVPNKEKLFKNVNPQDFYPVYGDNSSVHYEVNSQSPLFVKIERKKSYAMYGDYKTELNQTELARYDRTFNGAKLNIDEEYYAVRAFENYSNQSIQMDEFRGEGISGYYFLTKHSVVKNSEKISIEVRDRFHSEDVLNETRLTRYKDYEIDYDDGSIMFEEPIPSVDENLNPVWIVVRYESNEQGDKFFNYGGRAAVRYKKVVEVGATAIVQENDISDYNLLGIDTNVSLWDNKLNLKAEYAQSDGGVTTDGNERSSAKGYTLRLKSKSDHGEFAAHYRNIEAGFYNPSMRGSEIGTEKYGVSWRLSKLIFQRFKFSGEAYREIEDSKDRELNVAKALLGYSMNAANFKFGYQYSQSQDPEEEKESWSAIIGADITPIKNKNLRISIGHEQKLHGETVQEFPTKTMGKIEYTKDFESNYLNSIRIFNNTEYQYNAERLVNDDGEYKDRFVTTFGFDANVFNKTKLYTHTSFKENGKQVKEGITQTITPSERWDINLRSEAVQVIEGQGTEHQSYAAMVKYSPTKENYTSAKYEIRLGENATEDITKHVVGLEGKYKFSDNLRFVIKETFWYENPEETNDKKKSDGYIGASYRPLEHDKLNLISLLRFKYTGEGEHRELKALFSTEGILQLTKNAELRGRYAIKRTDWKSENSNGTIKAYTDLVLAEYLYNLNQTFDIGTGARVLHQYETDTYRYSFGGYLGMKILKNLYGLAGYNIVGFEDVDFEEFSYWKQGPYLTLRLKFSEELFR